jgi:uncharacterized protein
MLISVTVENFMSFGAEQELSAVANGRQTNLSEHLVDVAGHGEKLVPVIALYGANGAGKTNLVRAIAFLLRHALRGTPADYVSSARRKNLFAPATKPSRIVLRFLVESTVYELGVAALDWGFEREWLSIIKPTGSERRVFERTTTDGATTIEYGKDLDGFGDKMAALKVLGALPTELFLAKVLREVPEKELPPALAQVSGWLAHLAIVQPDSPYVLLEERLNREPKFKEHVAALLRDFGTGVSGLSTETSTLPLTELTPSQRDAFDRYPVGGAFARAVGGVLVKQDETTVGVHQLEAEHVSAGRKGRLPWEAESDGTRRLAHLAPATYEAGVRPFVFIVDELDRSLHALLVKAFIRTFLDRARGHLNQLIFTTHETSVLDQDLLRRDEVWFVEKTRGGASTLFSLDDFPVRTDLRLDRGYLMGRFGAVPAI